MRNKILSLLVLLLTAATGAWADEATVYTTQVSTATLKVGDILADGFSLTGGEKDNIILDGGRYKMDDILQSHQSDKLSVSHLSYKNYSFAYSIGGFYVFTPIDKKGLDGNAWVVTKINTNTETGLDIYLSGFNTIEVTPGATAGTWTFEMPAYDVEIAPIYAPAAKWATDGNMVLTPAAIEGIFAESTDAIVAAGTVAKGQGTAMYAVTSTNQATAPELSAFSATVPTAEKITAAGDVLVWYYIQGADTPQGQDPTAENTFNDSEICETPLTVTVLSNKFDITFNAANANTIEAGKATVKVGDAAATVTEGKLQDVKMGSEVKMTAKQGYKFRKVEVKKAAAAVLAPALENGAKFKVGYKWNNSSKTTYLEFTNSGGTYSLTSVSGDNVNNGFNSSTLTVKDGSVLALDVVCQPSGNPKMDDFSAQIEFDATSSTYNYSSKGDNFNGIISVSVNDTDVTDQLSELK